MDIERDTLQEIGISVGAVGLFLAVLIAIGSVFNLGGAGERGALALVASIVFFVLLMTGIGYWLANQY